MNRSVGSACILLGFGGQFAIYALRFLAMMLLWGLPYSILNIFDGLWVLLCAVGFLLLFRERGNPLDLVLAGLVGIEILTVFISFPFGDGILGLILRCIFNAFLIVWAFKIKDKNPLMSILLGCVFLWYTFINYFLFDAFHMNLPSMITNAIYLITYTVPPLAAFGELNE